MDYRKRKYNNIYKIFEKQRSGRGACSSEARKQREPSNTIPPRRKRCSHSGADHSALDPVIDQTAAEPKIPPAKTTAGNYSPGPRSVNHIIDTLRTLP